MIKQKFSVMVDPGEAYAFIDHLRELMDKTDETSLAGIKVTTDGTIVEFSAPPELLTSELADVIHVAAHDFKGWVSDPEEV
jgi:hypothetical protein